MNRKTAFALFAAVAAFACAANAEVVMDGSMGTAGPIEGTAGTYEVLPEYGQQAGANLFHSFRTFNLTAEEKAVFSGPDSVNNVISRVTGGQSSIYGAIQSQIAGANFYFLNPAGFIFGPNAGVDIQGAFHASTADYLRLGENDRYYSNPETSGVLSFEQPSAFGFLYDTSGAIEFDGGNLAVGDGESITLVGGDISVKNATLEAPEGLIRLAATKSAGEAVMLESDIDTSAFNTLGTVTVSDNAKVSTSGDASGTVVIRAAALYIRNGSVESDTEDSDGGSMLIRADTIELDGGAIFSDTFGSGTCGNIDISGSSGGPADSLAVKNGGRINSNTELLDDEYAGDAGNINIFANRIELSENGSISSYTRGWGNGGTITLSAPESVTIFNSEIFASSEGEDSYESEGETDIGVAGNITISTRSFTMTGANSVVSNDTWGLGPGGEISISGPGESHANSVTVDGGRIYSGALGSKDAGSVLIRSHNITFLNGGQIGSESFDYGKGGYVTLESTGTIEFSGKNEEEGNPSSIFTTAKSEYENNGAGDIVIRAGRAVVRDGATVAANTEGPGQAGTIDIDVNSLELHSEGTVSTATNAGGAAGDIDIEAGNVRLAGGSVIRSDSSSIEDPAGDAGTITIAVTDSLTLENSRVTTQAENAGKGQISITAGNWHGMFNSQVTTSIRKGGNDAGDITIVPPEWVTMNNSLVVANAWEGRGGNIHIVGDHFISSVNSKVDASSALGIDGSVEIESPDVDAGSGLIVLPAAFYDASKWMETPCALRSGESASRFVISGRDALPNKPYDISPPRLLWLDDEDR